MNLKFMFLITGIVLGFTTLINLRNLNNTSDLNWYYLSWVSSISCAVFIISSFFIDKKHDDNLLKGLRS
jgi:hypothetical protein